MTLRAEVLLDGLAFPEGPRWRDGELWFSDMHHQLVKAVDPQGRCRDVVRVENDPSGLGWLPDGRLLVVSMRDRRLLRLDAGGLCEHADLSGIATWHCNDMLTDTQGRSYVGNFGFDYADPSQRRDASLALVMPDGKVRVAATDLAFPNGSVLSPDGRQLVIAESFGARLTAFDVAPDGSLSGRRVFAPLERGETADGICLDAEGAIWVASPASGQVLRLHEGGRVSERVEVSTRAIACMLGGAQRRTLFVCSAGALDADECRARKQGRIEAVEVEVPGAGLP